MISPNVTVSSQLKVSPAWFWYQELAEWSRQRRDTGLERNSVSGTRSSVCGACWVTGLGSEHIPPAPALGSSQGITWTHRADDPTAWSSSPFCGSRLLRPGLEGFSAAFRTGLRSPVTCTHAGWCGPDVKTLRSTPRYLLTCAASVSRGQRVLCPTRAHGRATVL